jgi:hypothetical protein
MDNTSGAPSQGTRGATAAPPDNLCGHDSCTEESTIVPHPKQRLAKYVTSILRAISLFLLLGGVTGAVVWRFDFRQPGALQGSASGVVVTLMIGSVLVAAFIAALAFVVDLLFRIDWNAKLVPAHLEEGS